jgi:hypothetical protein
MNIVLTIFIILFPFTLTIAECIVEKLCSSFAIEKHLYVLSNGNKTYFIISKLVLCILIVLCLPLFTLIAFITLLLFIGWACYQMSIDIMSPLVQEFHFYYHKVKNGIFRDYIPEKND